MTGDEVSRDDSLEELAVVNIPDFLKDIGRGREGSRNLTVERARELFRAIFAGTVGELEIGGLMIALRMKGESIDEVDGALAALDEYVSRIPVDATRPVVSIPSYNGARNMANLTPLLACLLADAEVQVIVHGVRTDPRRVTSSQIMMAMGIAPVRCVADAPNLLARNDPVFVPIEVLAAPLARMLELRWKLGVRNIGHTVAKLLNPCALPNCLRLAAFTHPDFDRLQHALFARTHASALVMRGTEGEVVANSKRAAGIDWLHDGECQRLVESEPLPIAETPSLPPAQDAVATARWIQSVLAGERPVPPAIEAQVACILQTVNHRATPLAA
jgi:anthranilate phosphoribosyltransferase